MEVCASASARAARRVVAAANFFCATCTRSWYNEPAPQYKKVLSSNRSLGVELIKKLLLRPYRLEVCSKRKANVDLATGAVPS